MWNAILLYGIIRRVAPDIVHVNNGGYPGAESCLGAVIAGRLAGVRRVIMSVHNLARRPYPWGTVTAVVLDRIISFGVDCIIVATESVKKSLLANRSISSYKFVKIFYGVYLPENEKADCCSKQELAVSENTKIILCSARFDGTKGQEYLLQAVSLLRHEVQEFKCVFLGIGATHAEMQKLSRILEVDTYVFFGGYRNDVERFLKITDVLVQPSIAYENSPYSVLEAMTYSVPVIGTSVGGTAELVVHGQTGFIVPPQDAKALCDAIGVLLNDSKRAQTMGKAGQQRVNDVFSMEKAISQTLAVYQGETTLCRK